MARELDSMPLTHDETDDDIAMELTGLVLRFLSSKGVRAVADWDGCELLVSWKAPDEVVA